MRTRRVVSAVACAILAFPATHPAAASSQDVPAVQAGVQIHHDAVECMVANQYPRLDASLTPADKVAKAHIYFKSNRSPFYYVIMGKTGARLPRPSLDAGPITYYIEGFTLGGGSVQSEEINSRVVRSAEECKTRVAPIAPGPPVTVFGATGGVLPGFAGVALAAPAGAVGGASTAVVVGTGAAFVGLTSALFLTTGNSSPSQ